MVWGLKNKHSVLSHCYRLIACVSSVSLGNESTPSPPLWLGSKFLWKDPEHHFVPSALSTLQEGSTKEPGNGSHQRETFNECRGLAAFRNSLRCFVGVTRTDLDIRHLISLWPQWGTLGPWRLCRNSGEPEEAVWQARVYESCGLFCKGLESKQGFQPKGKIKNISVERFLLDTKLKFMSIILP